MSFIVCSLYLLSSGTTDFRVEISEDNVNWQLVLTDALDLIPVGDCPPALYFELVMQSPMRYARFVVAGYYNQGPALQYFGAVRSGT